ncbi:4-hydroxy-2-oxovalerate aldolase [Georgenia yuyongxinii]|uniref:4-hydroxy-2-oxovalerate aldolase n=1 Tax=Georgenia yuyongxinii TaxID=2589797 RepID=A0A5B8C4T9_9MICO|nr:aldolase/citrate lyase family protein [Georgenia yuyongxinii]QDC25789.1 4-hydroxy-2-oxovalerate aldolase [Georgenia yuyongxinii]
MSSAYSGTTAAPRPVPNLRAALAAGPVVGTFQVLASPAVTEVLALAGAQVIILDAEHAALDVTALEHHVRAARSVGGCAVVRVPEIGAYLSRSLDLGAAGVIVPRVETAAQARQVVEAVRFPPLGARGFGAGRASGFGLQMAGYRQAADAETAVVVMVETRRGLENVHEIAAVDGVDVIMVGPADLASSLGTEVGSAQHAAAVEAVFDAALAAGRHVGMHCADAAETATYAARGARLLLVATDSLFLAGSAARTFDDAASSLAEQQAAKTGEEQLQGRRFLS